MIRIFLKNVSITAIVPSFNSEHYIIETIECLLNQTIELEEIIVVDDSSDDRTYEKIIGIYNKSNKVKIYKLHSNHGASYSRNYGVKMAKGNYILFMDSDDIADCRLVEYEINKMIEMDRVFSKKCVLVHSAYRDIDENGIESESLHQWKQVGEDEILGYEFVRNNVSTSGVLIKRNIYDIVGGFDENLLYGEDWDLWLRAACIGGFGYVNKALIKVRRHKNSLSSNVKNMIESEKNILGKYDIDFIRKSIFNRNILYEVNLLDFVSLLYKLDYFEEGFNELRKAHRILNSNSSYYFLKGIYYLRNNLYDNAEDEFLLTLKLNKEHGAALNNLGVLLALKNKINEAIKVFQKIHLIYPKYNDAKKNLEILNNQSDLSNLRFTLRELRPVLTKYFD